MFGAKSLNQLELLGDLCLLQAVFVIDFVSFLVQNRL